MKATIRNEEQIHYLWVNKYIGQTFELLAERTLIGLEKEVLLKFPEGNYYIPYSMIEKITIDEIIETIDENVISLIKRKDMNLNSEKNNGGSTNYYDLPLPKTEILKEILQNAEDFVEEVEDTIEKIINCCPKTINDLIEFKNMMPWQHEVIKSCYAINERAKKEGGSEERELNKQIYYINRRRKQLGLKLYKLED